MILRLRKTLRRLRRLRLATVVTLSVALLALPCSPFAEALGSHAGHAVAAAVPTHSGHSHTNLAHDPPGHEGNCCTDCSVWLTARFDDGSAAILAHNWSRGDLFPVAVAHASLVSSESFGERRFRPPPVAFVESTRLYAKTRRYRI